MSILDRLNLLIRSEISDLTRGGSTAMREMEGSLREARRSKAELRRSEASLVKQIRDARDKANRWEGRAILALENSDEELAREALVMKNRALEESSRLRDELDDYRSQIQDIERALEALELKLEGTRGRIESARPAESGGRRPGDEAAWDAEMRRRMRGEDAPARSSDATLDPRDPDEPFDTSRAFSEFDRMSSKIGEMEANIESMRELAGDDLIDPRRRELEDIFTRMEKKKRGDADLAALKKQNDDLADLKKKFE